MPNLFLDVFSLYSTPQAEQQNSLRIHPQLSVKNKLLLLRIALKRRLKYTAYISSWCVSAVQ